MIEDKDDAEWHVRLWKASLRSRDGCHQSTEIWKFFDEQSARIKKQIDDFISKNPESISLLEEENAAKGKAGSSNPRRKRVSRKNGTRSRKLRNKSKQSKKST